MNNPIPPDAWGDKAMAVAYLSGLSDPVVVLDADTCVREVNRAFLSFASVTREGLLHQPIRPALRHAAHLAPFIDAAEDLGARRATDRVLLQIGPEQETSQTIVLTGVPLDMAEGEPLLAVRVEDVTEMMRERAESDAQRIAAYDSARALERLNKELEGFSYSVAHDLRAPLRFIDKFAYLLMERHSHELSSEGLQFAEQIREGTRQMAQLVEDLLQFSRVTGQELKREQIDMNRLVAQVVEEVQYDIEDRDVDIQIGDLGRAKGDPALVRQVFANLLGNAVKFTRREKLARISVTRSGSPAVFTVSDNGVGFAADDAERLFTVFQRYHQPDDFEGSGVGLAVVKRVVSRHGGAAWAESNVGKGAKFHFTLEPKPGDGESESMNVR